MQSKFETVGVLARVKNPGVLETLHTLVDFLKSLNQKMILDEETAKLLDETGLDHVSRQLLPQRCDILIVVGGDGSLLQTAQSVAEEGTPVLGVNRGRLGFLTDIHPSELSKIQHILARQYILEKRFLLTATVKQNGISIATNNALNEVALIPDTVPHMNQFEIYIDDQFVLSQDSDGVIVATPTGSTAYALSGGGPILHPKLDAIVIVPMFPHTLSIRPIVIEGNSRVTIIVTSNTATPRISCDGQAFINAPAGTQIDIHKKNKQLNLIHPLDYDYYETLRSKLHWGQKVHYTG